MKDVEIKLPETRDIPRKPAAVADIFPRRQKSKLIRPKPNLWEVTKEETKNLKNTLLKEKSESPKPVTRRNKMSKKWSVGWSDYALNECRLLSESWFLINQSSSTLLWLNAQLSTVRESCSMEFLHLKFNICCHVTSKRAYALWSWYAKKILWKAKKLTGLTIPI